MRNHIHGLESQESFLGSGVSYADVIYLSIYYLL